MYSKLPLYKVSTVGKFSGFKIIVILCVRCSEFLYEHKTNFQYVTLMVLKSWKCLTKVVLKRWYVLGFTLISSIIFGLNTPLVNRHVSSFSFHCVRKTSRLKLDLIFSRSLSSIFGFVSTMTSSNANHLLLISKMK